MYLFEIKCVYVHMPVRAWWGGGRGERISSRGPTNKMSDTEFDPRNLRS